MAREKSDKSGKSSHGTKRGTKMRRSELIKAGYFAASGIKDDSAIALFPLLLPLGKAGGMRDVQRYSRRIISSPLGVINNSLDPPSCFLRSDL